MSNGRPVGHLLPVVAHPLAALVRTGVVRPASRTLDLQVTQADVAASEDPADTLAAVVQRDREDRI